jgi:N-methylhydantoinase A/acetophenone carboxylase
MIHDTVASNASTGTLVTVDLDVGGTFTDGFFTRGGEVVTVKVDTTPHDLTVCFWHCLEEGAAGLGYQRPSEMLAQTRVLRFATTVGTNALLQGTGPKLGMIVTQGEKERIYSEKVSPLLTSLVDRI